MRVPPALGIAALAPAAVLALDVGGFFPFGPAKWLAISAGVPAAAALLLWRRPVRWAPAATAAGAALVAVMVLAAAVGEDDLYAWIGTPERRFGALTWALVLGAFVLGQSTVAEDRRLVAGGLVVAGAGLGGAALLEAAGAWPHMLDAGSRLGGTFGSPAYLGAGGALLLPAVVGVGLDGSWSRRWRVVATAAGAALVVAAVGSGARAGWVGLAVAGAVTAVAQRRRWPGRVAVGRALLVAVPLAAAVVVLSPVGARVVDTFDADAPGGRGRLDEWRVAARVLAEHPLTGVGPEGYRVTVAEGIDPAYEDEHGRDPLPDRAHAGPLDIALAGGPLALAAWVALVVALTGPVRRALAGDQAWLAGVGAGLVGYGAGQLLLFPLAELEPVAAVLAGVVVAADGRARLRAALVVPRLLPIAFAAVAGVAVVAGGFELAADRQADQAAEALGRFDPPAAVAHARRAVDRRPDILRNHLLLAAALEADRQGAVVALAAVDDALAVSPRDPIALRRRAELLVVRADSTLVPAHIRTARDELARYLEDDPNNSELWILSGVVARLDGDPDAARAALQRAGELTPSDPRPFLALIQLELEQLRVDGTG